MTPYDATNKSHLAWLADGMRANGQSVFIVESLQPSWLPAPWWSGVARWVPVGLAAAGYGLFVVLAVRALESSRYMGDAFDEVRGGGIAAAVVAVVLGLLVARRGGSPVRPMIGARWPFVRRSVPRRAAARYVIVFILVCGVVGGLIASGLGGLIPRGSIGDGTPRAIFDGVWVGGLVGLYCGLGSLLYGMALSRMPTSRSLSEAQGKTIQGWLHSGLQGGFWVGCVGVVLGNLLLWLPWLEWGEWPEYSVFFLLIGLYEGVLFFPLVGLAYGWFAVIQHAVVRVFLWLNGRLPLRMGRFLDGAAEQGVLRKVDGGYAVVSGETLERLAMGGNGTASA